ncbi:NPCBM/NEW2 domain-containing protein [Deinococcus sp. YIM 77859]|uniref:NPCBM/NEW2 domain-containing protein n=1 Tax=Deinococcus sp. YIM 77859 TaxID=1540221 RepID=UPI00068EB876|nr:NPCBM/NEW2 domain-containing protein [Deinococcus sp. YIM 77859]
MKKPVARRLLAASLSLLLAACGQSPVDAPAGPNPYAAGASFPWSYTPAPDQLTPLSLTPGENTLYYEPILAATNGWGPVEIDRSNGEHRAGDGRTLTLNGKTYRRGFGVHASSELRFGLKGTGAVCTRFTVEVGVDDEVGRRGSVVFQVYLDGEKAYDSGVMTGASATQRVELGIAGKQELRLVVTDAGDGINYDHADWANPKVFCQKDAPPSPGSLDATFAVGGRAAVGGVDAALEAGTNVLLADTAGGDFALRRLLPNGDLREVRADLGGQDAAFAIARQPDGRIVVAGQSGDAVALVRYNPDLTLDDSFGTAGKVVTALGGSAAAYAVAVQPDGGLVVAGRINRVVPPDPEPHADGVVLRYNANGQLDPTFGTGGRVFLSFDVPTAPTEDEARAVTVQPDGKIVVAGKSDAPGGATGWLLARLNPNGSLDTTFAQNGAERGGYYGLFNDVVLEPDGDIVAVGYEGRFVASGVVRRYRSDGSLQAAATVRFSEGSPASQNTLSDVWLQPDGKLLVGGMGRADSSSSATQYGLARLKPDLSLDPSFGTGGQVLTGLPVTFLPEGLPATPLGALLQQPDGKIIVVSGQTARYWP